MIHVKEMMQDNDLKNSKSKDKGSRLRSQSMNEQSHYKQDKTKIRQSINVKSHIFNIGGDNDKTRQPPTRMLSVVQECRHRRSSHSHKEDLYNGGGEQPSAQVVSNAGQAAPVNEEKALVLHTSEEKSSEEDISRKKETDDEPPTKKLKFLIPPSSIPSPTPLKSIMPEPPKVTEAIKMTLDQFTKHLSKTTSSIFSHTPPRELTPLRDESKGKGIATEEPLKDIMPFLKEGCLVLKISSLKSFVTLKGPLSQEKIMAQLKEMKRLISFRADPLPVIKINYVVNPNKEETMKIIRGDNPLNIINHPNFRLKTLGFSEWLKVYAMASKKTGKLNDMLLKSLRAKFQWVINQAKKLGFPPPPALATFGMTVEDKKRKWAEFLKEVFVTEDIRVDGMYRNLIPPPGVVPI
ncbi:hypothetical protein Tco_0003991 [Tanacetum coccineum]